MPPLASILPRGSQKYFLRKALVRRDTGDTLSLLLLQQQKWSVLTYYALVSTWRFPLCFLAIISLCVFFAEINQLCRPNPYPIIYIRRCQSDTRLRRGRTKVNGRIVATTPATENNVLTFFPLTRGCSEGVGAFCFLLKAVVRSFWPIGVFFAGYRSFFFVPSRQTQTKARL